MKTLVVLFRCTRINARAPRPGFALYISVRDHLPILLPRVLTVRPKRRRRTAERQFYHDDSSTCSGVSGLPWHSCSTRSNVRGRSARRFDGLSHVSVRNRGQRCWRNVLFVDRLRNSGVVGVSVDLCLFRWP